MFWFVYHKIGLFLALSHCKNMFSQFPTSHADFYLKFSKQRFRLFSAKLHCFQHYVFENSLLIFLYPNCAFDALSYQKHVLFHFSTAFLDGIANI